MKRLSHPKVPDFKKLKLIKSDSSFGAHQAIQSDYRLMRQKYFQYRMNGGNPWCCIGFDIPQELKEKLLNHYEKPREELKYINEIRVEASPEVCPMCGSPSACWTLDHYLPKADYPEWTIYSKNLIPSCECNLKRGTSVKGNKTNERVLHPYFDQGLNHRIVHAQFSGNLDAPTIEIVALPSRVLHSDTIQFHIDNVINKSKVINKMNRWWQQMKKSPRKIVSTIPRNNPVLTLQQLEQYLNDYIEDEDDRYETPNNWSSMFAYGILHSATVKQWLLNRHNGIVTGRIDPLS